jgi:predicted RNA-binding protein with RPS1 domain
MCFSLAAFNPAGLPVRILDPKCVAKTFPDYFETLFSVSRTVPAPHIPVICVDGPTRPARARWRSKWPTGWATTTSTPARCTASPAWRPPRRAWRWTRPTSTAIATLAETLPLRLHRRPVLLDGEDVTDAIRTEEAGMNASKRLGAAGRAHGPGGAAAALSPPAGPGGRRPRHGHRDLPDAPLKVYLTASAAQRAERRYKQLISKGFRLQSIVFAPTWRRAMHATPPQRRPSEAGAKMPSCWTTRANGRRIGRTGAELVGRKGSLSRRLDRWFSRPPSQVPSAQQRTAAVFNPTGPQAAQPPSQPNGRNGACEPCTCKEKSMSESFAALFEESLQRSEMRAGEVITAEVVRVEHNHVVVNAGLKSEAYVPIDEFKNDKGEVEVQAGDFVSVAIDAIENGYGDTILSRDKAKRLASWMSLEKALESGEFVTGTTSGKVKGGLTVLVNGIRAFLPGSLIDTRPIKDLTPYENKTLEFKVIKLDRKRNNVVLSRRAVVEASMGEERAKLMETLKEGSIVRGVVKNITEYGAFVDLGGIDGLLHITDMAWRRVRHPSEVVQAGQEITAKILKFDTEKNRVSLGLKQMGDDPWMGVSAATRNHPHVRQGHQHRRLRRVRRTRTRHRRPGARLRNGLDQQERRSRPRSCPWATKSKSWSWRSTKTSAASAWA